MQKFFIKNLPLVTGNIPSIGSLIPSSGTFAETSVTSINLAPMSDFSSKVAVANSADIYAGLSPTGLAYHMAPYDHCLNLLFDGTGQLPKLKEIHVGATATGCGVYVTFN